MMNAPRMLAVFALSLLLSPAARAAETTRLAADCPVPDYVNAWVRGDIQGSVTIAYSTDSSGRIVQSSLLTSSGYKQLDEATLKAVKQCKAVHPGTELGQGVSGKVRYDWRIQ